MAPKPSSNDQLLTRSVAEIIDRRSLETKLRRREPLRIKYGIDPTGHDVHLGHAVALRKLRAWQDAGHTAVLIIGDYTAQVGDPSGKDKERPALSAKTVESFASTYLDQIGKIINLSAAEIHRNSEWYQDFSPAAFLRLLSTSTVQQLLAHETFHQRMQQDRPLSLVEFVYPLLQGYDSVMIKADVELGGLDQKFNLLAGRDVQTKYEQDVQDVMLVPYLLGLDGKQKMSKSLKNYIGLLDTPSDMFGKIMSIPDKLIAHYYELATTVSEEKIQEVKKSLKQKKNNPRDLKAELAKTIVTLYHDERQAEAAEQEFIQVFRHKKAPTKPTMVTMAPGKHQLINLLVSQRLVESRSAARRMIEQGGVKYNNSPVTDWEATILIANGAILQLGKRTFVQFTTSS